MAAPNSWPCSRSRWWFLIISRFPTVLSMNEGCYIVISCYIPLISPSSPFEPLRSTPVPSHGTSCLIGFPIIGHSNPQSLRYSFPVPANLANLLGYWLVMAQLRKGLWEKASDIARSAKAMLGATVATPARAVSALEVDIFKGTPGKIMEEWIEKFWKKNWPIWWSRTTGNE